MLGIGRPSWVGMEMEMGGMGGPCAHLASNAIGKLESESSAAMFAMFAIRRIRCGDRHGLGKYGQ